MMPGSRTYAIRFDIPGEDKPIYAADHKGACGFAMTLRSAFLFPDEDVALRMLRNGYGEEWQKWARVIEVKG